VCAGTTHAERSHADDNHRALGVVEDVAKHLGVARDSAYRWIESRGLLAHKVGRIWKLKLSQVDAWVEAGGAKADEQEGGDR
jgi:excisionase family DNA binding protein